jgi:FO synthase
VYTFDDERLSEDECYDLLRVDDLASLLGAAAKKRDRAHGNVVSYSRKVFIPLTRLCRDVCHYCTFAQSPHRLEKPFMSPNEVLQVARAGRAAGCREALFTLGDKPELRYSAARKALDALGYPTTLAYLQAMAKLVFDETGLLPHLNPGLLQPEDLARLRTVSVSQGIMLESASERLMQRGGVHFGSPDKSPALRLATIEAAGEQHVPFTSGILIGIGETRRERIEALLTLRDLHDRHGHLQEIIVQNFRPKPDTRMQDSIAPSIDDHVWTIAVARLIFDPAMNIQAPPNLSPGSLAPLIDAGINDWGGVSPVTPDWVNPEAPWPHLAELDRATAAAGKRLVQRLAVYPGYVRKSELWIDGKLRSAVLKSVDADGWPVEDDWRPGRNDPLPATDAARAISLPALIGGISQLLNKAQKGATLSEAEIITMFRARDEDFSAICAAADALRRDVVGDNATYVITRNINYTNICSFKCQFCAFSKGKTSEALRGKPYLLSLTEIRQRVIEARARAATEVCMQGGIHPDYTGDTYLDICRAVKSAAPAMHIHAFSPLEIQQGARTLGLSLHDFLSALKTAGLGTLPGTAAEILDDEVRAIICPDKIDTKTWFEVMRTAHRLGIRSTATIMFGHVDRYEHWARHLLRLRDLQADTGGFTELVPLPFVHMEAPIFLKGRSRSGPTFRESVLMHAVGRLVLHPLLPNIQTSWVKMGAEGARICLQSGANDLGGTLMEESITRAAGATHGQEMTPAQLQNIAHEAGRMPLQRTTLYEIAGGAWPAAATANEAFGKAPVVDATMSRNASPNARSGRIAR